MLPEMQAYSRYFVCLSVHLKPFLHNGNPLTKMDKTLSTNSIAYCVDVLYPVFEFDENSNFYYYLIQFLSIFHETSWLYCY